MAQEAPTRETEEERVFKLRMQRFLELGFTQLESELLAEADVDWHDAARRFIEKGCSTQLAFEILI